MTLSIINSTDVREGGGAGMTVVPRTEEELSHALHEVGGLLEARGTGPTLAILPDLQCVNRLINILREEMGLESREFTFLDGNNVDMVRWQVENQLIPFLNEGGIAIITEGFRKAFLNAGYPSFYNIVSGSENWVRSMQARLLGDLLTEDGLSESA